MKRKHKNDGYESAINFFADAMQLTTAELQELTGMPEENDRLALAVEYARKNHELYKD